MEFVTVARVADVQPGTVSAVKAGEVEIALVNLDGNTDCLRRRCQDFPLVVTKRAG